jgi:hypothetical protein
MPTRTDNAQLDAPLATIHTDLCGPMNVQTRRGFKSFQGLLDGATMYAWIILMKRKSEAATQIISFVDKMRLQTEFRVTTLRSDNGGEFTSE